MTVQLAKVNGGRLPQHASKSFPRGVLGLNGWANRLMVAVLLVVFVFARQAIKLRSKTGNPPGMNQCWAQTGFAPICYPNSTCNPSSSTRIPPRTTPWP
jgi:hypothetical protein